MIRKMLSMAAGLALAGLVVLAGCSSPVGSSPAGTTAKKGYGTASFSFGYGGDARTVFPAMEQFKKITGDIVGPQNKPGLDLTAENTFTLPVGDYTIVVKAYASTDAAPADYSAISAEIPFKVEEKPEPTEVSVLLEGIISGTGTLAWDFTIPVDAKITSFKIFDLNKTATVPFAEKNTKADSVVVSSGASYALEIEVSIATENGTYLAHATEVFHIYKNLTTTWQKTIVPGDFNGKIDSVTPSYPGYPGPVNATEGDEGFHIGVTFEPEDAYNQGIDWKSSNRDAADVDENGNVTIKGPGEATITGTSKADPDKEVNVDIIVKAKPVPVTGVSIQNDGVDFPGPYTMKNGQTVQLNALVQPPDATNKDYTWSSSKSEFADVDASGKVTAYATGDATITVTTTDGSKTDTVLISVKNPVEAFVIKDGSATVSGTTIEMQNGDTGKQLSVQVTTPAAPDAYTPTWTVLSGVSATVNPTSGLVSPAASVQGQTVIQAAIGTVTATVTINVTSKTGTGGITIGWPDADLAIEHPDVLTGSYDLHLNRDGDYFVAYQWLETMVEKSTDSIYTINFADKQAGQTYNIIARAKLSSGKWLSAEWKFTMPPAVVEPVSSFTINQTEDMNFDSLGSTSGYTYTQPAARTVTINNTGETALALTIGKSGTGANDYTLNATTRDIAAGGSATFTVRPNAGLAEGNHLATITVSGTGVESKSFKVSFTNRNTNGGGTGIFGLYARNVAANSQYGGNQAVDTVLASFEGESPVLKIAPATTNTPKEYTWGWVNHHMDGITAGTKNITVTMKIFVVGTGNVQVLLNNASAGAATFINQTISAGQWVTLTNTISWNVPTGEADRRVGFDVGGLSGKTFYIADFKVTAN